MIYWEQEQPPQATQRAALFSISWPSLVPVLKHSLLGAALSTYSTESVEGRRPAPIDT